MSFRGFTGPAPAPEYDELFARFEAINSHFGDFQYRKLAKDAAFKYQKSQLIPTGTIEALCLLYLGRHSDAEKKFKALSQRCPIQPVTNESITLYLNYGYLLFLLGKSDQAAFYYDQHFEMIVGLGSAAMHQALHIYFETDQYEKMQLLVDKFNAQNHSGPVRLFGKMLGYYFAQQKLDELYHLFLKLSYTSGFTSVTIQTLPNILDVLASQMLHDKVKPSLTVKEEALLDNLYEVMSARLKDNSVHLKAEISRPDCYSVDESLKAMEVVLKKHDNVFRRLANL